MAVLTAAPYFLRLLEKECFPPLPLFSLHEGRSFLSFSRYVVHSKSESTASSHPSPPFHDLRPCFLTFLSKERAGIPSFSLPRRALAGAFAASSFHHTIYFKKNRCCCALTPPPAVPPPLLFSFSRRQGNSLPYHYLIFFFLHGSVRRFPPPLREGIGRLLSLPPFLAPFSNDPFFFFQNFGGTTPIFLASCSTVNCHPPSFFPVHLRRKKFAFPLPFPSPFSDTPCDRTS